MYNNANVGAKEMGSIVEKLIKEGRLDEAYKYLNNNKELENNVIRKHIRDMGDYIYNDYIEKDPCEDNRYNIVRTEPKNSSGGDGGCCGGVLSLLLTAGGCCWCYNNPEECAECSARCCTDSCTACCCW